MHKFVPTLLLILGLVACASPPLPDDHYYRLDIGAPGTAPATTPPLIDSLNVRRINMVGIYGERPLLYSSVQAPTELRQYHYHYWADNPARLIQEQLVEYLRAARLARVVTATANDTGAVTQYQLDGTLLRFEQILDGNRAHAQVVMDLTLQRTADGQRVFRKRYRADILAHDSTPLATTQALGQALTQCYAAFSTDLRNNKLMRQ